MATSSNTYHEPLEQISPAARDLHRALTSLQEELEAIDWYNQRAESAGDDELRGILLHNMEEEIEHASMILEWLRRRHPLFAEKLGTYLNKTAPILQIEKSEEPGADAESPRTAPKGFTIGSLVR